MSDKISQRLDEQKARKAAAARVACNRLKGRGHPTTADMDYSEHELEFMKSMEEFKKVSGHQFPTFSEILRVVRSLGYSKAQDAPGMKKGPSGDESPTGPHG